jgi:hypothetical protein
MTRLTGSANRRRVLGRTTHDESGDERDQEVVMRRLRLALAVLAVGLAASSGTAYADGQCPNAFYSGQTGTCGMTGRVSGGGCICEYECDGTEEPLNWFNFCG